MEAEHSHASEGGRHDAGVARGRSPFRSFRSSREDGSADPSESARASVSASATKRGGAPETSPSSGADATGAHATRASRATNARWSRTAASSDASSSGLGFAAVASSAAAGFEPNDPALPAKSDPNRDLAFREGFSGESSRAPSGVSRYRRTARPWRFAAAASTRISRSAASAASSTAARVTPARMPSPARVSRTRGSSNGAAGKETSADAASSAANSGTRGSYSAFGENRFPEPVRTKGAFAINSEMPSSWCVSEPSVRSASSIARSSARAGKTSSLAKTRVFRNAAGETRATPRHVSSTCACSSSVTRRKLGPKSAGSGFTRFDGGRHGGSDPSRDVKIRLCF